MVSEYNWLVLFLIKDVNSYIYIFGIPMAHIHGLVQEKHNSIANARELHLSCINPSICRH